MVNILMSRLDDRKATILSGMETALDKYAANQWRSSDYSLFLGSFYAAEHAVQLEDTLLKATCML